MTEADGLSHNGSDVDGVTQDTTGIDQFIFDENVIDNLMEEEESGAVGGVDDTTTPSDPSTTATPQHNYNLRDTPSQSSESSFNRQNFKYSFLQHVKSDFDIVDDAIKNANVTDVTQKVNTTWKSVSDGERPSLVDDKHTPTYSKTTCTNNIAKELSSMQAGKAYNPELLHKSLIQLMYLLMNDKEHKQSYHCFTQMSANQGVHEFGQRAVNAMVAEYEKLKGVDVFKPVCFTQMSAKKGIQEFGQRAVDAMVKEYEQLEGLKVFTPVNPTTLPFKSKKDSLNAIDLIKEKRSGKIKGRTVCDGRKQRTVYTTAEVSSPALSQDGFFASLAIDALEGRHIATSDIAGAFLKADQDDYVIVKLRGPAVDAMLKINKAKYEPFVTHEKNKKVIYVRLLKAMYGTLTAPILWYKLFASTLIEKGFKINPYDLCVANKLVNKNQMTICWYVDDLKVSHVQQDEVKKMILELEEKFGKMSTVYGNNHTYLGMDITIRDKKVVVDMKSYLIECIEAFGEGINSVAKTPAQKSLLDVDDMSPRLDQEKSDLYHHIVAKLLHVSKRARLDILPTITFMCRRVHCSTEEDWGKLRRLLQYINGTLDLKRILSLKSFSEMAIYVDASHAPNEDFKGQTGGCIVMGDGVLHANSTKQKINTKSSTETELVGTSDYIPYALWFLYFMQEQGYTVDKKICYQDNQSTIKLLKNGKKSAGKQSRHIAIRYFWITDRFKAEKIDVEYCPTGMMLGDFFTKPLQGSLFRRMRDVVQGMESISILKTEDELNEPSDENATEEPEASSEPNDKTQTESFQKKGSLSCSPHVKERVGLLRIKKSKGGNVSEQENGNNKGYVGYRWRTYKPTYKTQYNNISTYRTKSNKQ